MKRSLAMWLVSLGLALTFACSESNKTPETPDPTPTDPTPTDPTPTDPTPGDPIELPNPPDPKTVECPDADSDAVTYTSKDVSFCQRARIGCAEGKRPFNNECGCGCIDI